MRSFLPLLLSAVVLVVPASRGEPPAKPVAEEQVAAPARSAWKIHHFTVSQQGAQLAVEASEGGRHLLLKSSTNGDTRLLSASFSAESNELHAEVLIDGVRHSLVQNTTELGEGARSGAALADSRRYENLSAKAREKFREELRTKFGDAEFRTKPEDERRAVIRALFEKIEKEDQMPR